MVSCKTKVCNSCGNKYLATNEFFNWQNRKLGYLKSVCKECHCIDSKKRYKQDPERHYRTTREWKNNNKEKCIEYRKKWLENNIEKDRASKIKYYKENPEKCRESSERWIRENREKYLTYKREYYKKNALKHKMAAEKRYSKDPNLKKMIVKKNNAKRRATPKGNLCARMGLGIWRSLKGKKNGRSWESLVDYTYKDLMDHIENQFVEGMSWENMGEWHIDHKIPLVVHNFTKPTHMDFSRAWSLENLQPLWAKDNMRKHAKLDKPFQPSLAL